MSTAGTPHPSTPNNDIHTVGVPPTPPEAHPSAAGEGHGRPRKALPAARYTVRCSRYFPTDEHPFQKTQSLPCDTRVQVRAWVRELHARGFWVEVFDVPTGELVNGPFNPDHPLPTLSF